MAKEKKRRERNDKEEKVGVEEAPEQEEVLSPSGKTLTEVPNSEGLNKPSSPSPFLPASNSASNTFRLEFLSQYRTCSCDATSGAKHGSKRNSFFWRFLRMISSKFARNRKHNFSFFISEVKHSTLSMVTGFLGRIRSIILKNQVFPLQTSEERENKKDFTGKTGDFDDEDEHSNRLKEAIYFVVMSITFRLFNVILIFIHIALLITALTLTPKGTRLPFTYHILFLLFGLFFLIDVLFQVFLEGLTLYFSSVINVLDFFASIFFVVLDVTYIFFDIQVIRQIPKLTFLLKYLRLFMLIKIFQLSNSKKKIEKAARKLVSENKRRYRKDGFDLDLTYVTSLCSLINLQLQWLVGLRVVT